MRRLGHPLIKGIAAIAVIGGAALYPHALDGLGGSSTTPPAATVPAAYVTTGQIPPDPRFPCEEAPYTTVCTPQQSQVLIDRNCAQSHAAGDECGIDTDPATGMRYAYNIQSPAHAQQSEQEAQQATRKVYDALTKDGGQCTVIAHD